MKIKLNDSQLAAIKEHLEEQKNDLQHEVYDFTCKFCGHSWELGDKDPYVCHNCGKDNAHE